jgi:hypothetical protein
LDKKIGQQENSAATWHKTQKATWLLRSWRKDDLWNWILALLEVLDVPGGEGDADPVLHLRIWLKYGQKGEKFL